MIYKFISFNRANSAKVKKYSCPICPQTFNDELTLFKHVEEIHGDEIPENVTTKQFIFNMRRGKDFQLCQICKINHTDWNEKTGRYKPICNDQACHDEMRRRFLENYKKKNGKDHSIDDPEMQKKMLYAKKNSGVYQFKDGTKIAFASQYEEDFLQCWEQDIQMPGKSIRECDVYFNYKYEGKDRTYIPDYYCEELNLVIEIKASDNTHPKILAVDKETELLKDKAVVESHQFNYIKIYDKKYESLYELVDVLQHIHLNDKINESDVFIVIPKDTRPIKQFKMPKLVFLQDKDVFSHEMMMRFYKTLEPLELALIIDKGVIPSEYDAYGDLLEDKTILRKSKIDSMEDKDRVNQVFREFTKYYTKSYEKFINQDFLGVFLPVPIKKYLIVNIYTKDIKIIDKFTNILLKDKCKFITTMNKISHSIIVKETDVNKVKSWISRLGYKDTSLELRDNMIAVPGTNHGNFMVLLDEDRSDF